MKSGHHSIIDRRRGPGVRVSSHSTPSGRTALVAAALTPPTMAIASADRAAARRGEPRSAPITRGSSTHGARALGQTSMEDGPRTVSMRGERAKASPPRMQARSERAPIARATLAVPTRATHMTRAIQSLCTTQPGRSTSPPRAKNGPIGHR